MHESASLTVSGLFSFALAGKGDRGDRGDRNDRGDRGDRFDNGGGFRDRFDRDREGGEDSLLMVCLAHDKQTSRSSRLSRPAQTSGSS